MSTDTYGIVGVNVPLDHFRDGFTGHMT